MGDYCPLSSWPFSQEPKGSINPRRRNTAIRTAVAAVVVCCLFYLQASRAPAHGAHGSALIRPSDSSGKAVTDKVLTAAVDGESSLKYEENTRRSILAVLVEEHQHVLRYWISRFEAGLHGAVLVHVDAHDDMAEPQTMPNVGGLASYDPSNARIGNDEFIMYAVLAGGISKIFWLRPEWHNQQAVLTGVVRVGKTTYKNGRQNGACSCQVLSRFGKKRKSTDCETWKGDEIAESMCHILKSVPYYSLPLSQAHKVKDELSLADAPWLLDVDLDYFGVDSPASELAERGIKEREQRSITSVVSALCVDNAQGEGAASAMLVKMLHGEPVEEPPTGVKTCGNGVWGGVIQEISETFSGMSHKKKAIMQDIGFCVKPEHLEVPNKKMFMTLCTGNSGANDASGSRVKLHNTDEEELKKAAAVMTSLIQTMPHEPTLITVCRSGRDGYLPRQLASTIEAVLMEQLGQAVAAWGTLKTEYDPMLRLQSQSGM